MDEIMIKVIEFLLIVTITMVVRYGIPYAKSKIENEKLKTVLGWIEQSVAAAEQTVVGKGSDRKEVVLAFARQILRKNNVSITDEQLETLIESAVYAMNQAKKED